MTLTEHDINLGLSVLGPLHDQDDEWPQLVVGIYARLFPLKCHHINVGLSISHGGVSPNLPAGDGRGALNQGGHLPSLQFHPEGEGGDIQEE